MTTWSGDYRIEAITLPVGHVDRAKEFYVRAGWRLAAATEPAPGFRIVQLTSPGSHASFADPDGNVWLVQEVPSRASSS